MSIAPKRGRIAADDPDSSRAEKLKIATSQDAPDLQVWYDRSNGRMHGQTNEETPTAAGTLLFTGIPPGARQVEQEQAVA